MLLGLINAGLQPGELRTEADRNRLKRFLSLDLPDTGMKSGVNERYCRPTSDN